MIWSHPDRNNPMILHESIFINNGSPTCFGSGSNMIMSISWLETCYFRVSQRHFGNLCMPRKSRDFD